MSPSMTLFTYCFTDLLYVETLIEQFHETLYILVSCTLSFNILYLLVLIYVYLIPKLVLKKTNDRVHLLFKLSKWYFVIKLTELEGWDFVIYQIVITLMAGEIQIMFSCSQVKKKQQGQFRNLGLKIKIDWIWLINRRARSIFFFHFVLGQTEYLD